MAIGPRSPTQIVNQALARIGVDNRIGDILEGTETAQVALDLYGQARDALLREAAPGFSERSVALTLLKSAPDGGYFPPLSWSNVYPPPPWRYEYEYPADCIAIRAIKYPPQFLTNIDPQPSVFRVINDNGYSTPVKAIVCNVPNAVLVYTAQIVDMTTWEPLFVDALVAKLAELLGPAVAAMKEERIAADRMASMEERIALPADDAVQG
jgi:hypothetical protein